MDLSAGHGDPDDRIASLGHECEFWTIVDDSEAGAMVDWPGCPLVISKESAGLVVWAEVGRVCVADYELGDPDGLETFIDVDIGDLRLEYSEPSEVAWLVGDEHGDLRGVCEEIARLAPTVAERMIELEVMMYPPTTTFDDRTAHGPWFSASGPAPAGRAPRSDLKWTEHDGRSWTATGPTGTHWQISDHGSAGARRFGITVAHWDHPDWWAATLDEAKDLAAEIDARPPIPASDWVVEREVVTPEPGDEYVAYATNAVPPVGPCECGSSATASAVTPQRESSEWWDDPGPFWRCPDCGRCRGDVPRQMYEDEST